MTPRTRRLAHARRKTGVFPLLRSLLLVVAEVSDIIHIVSPILLDLDPSLEVDLCAHEALDVAAGLGRDLLEHRAVLPMMIPLWLAFSQ